MPNLQRSITPCEPDIEFGGDLLADDLLPCSSIFIFTFEIWAEAVAVDHWKLFGRMRFELSFKPGVEANIVGEKIQSRGRKVHHKMREEFRSWHHFDWSRPWIPSLDGFNSRDFNWDASGVFLITQLARRRLDEFVSILVEHLDELVCSIETDRIL